MADDGVLVSGVRVVPVAARWLMPWRAPVRLASAANKPTETEIAGVVDRDAPVCSLIQFCAMDRRLPAAVSSCDGRPRSGDCRGADEMPRGRHDRVGMQAGKLHPPKVARVTTPNTSIALLKMSFCMITLSERIS